MESEVFEFIRFDVYEYNAELKRNAGIIEGSSERELVMRQVILAQMRAQRNGQIPLGNCEMMTEVGLWTRG